MVDEFLQLPSGHRSGLSELDDPVQSARFFFDSAEGAFDALGFTDAADNLRRFRSGQGGTKHFSDGEIEEHFPILEAEDENRTRFEAKTFVGQTDGREDLSRRLLTLRDGETFEFEDEFNRSMVREIGEMFLEEPLGSLRNGLGVPTYLAFGRGDVRSDGKFTATREGDRLTIRGEVQTCFDEDQDDNRFDFNPGQSGSGSARTLEREGEAAPSQIAVTNFAAQPVLSDKWA